MKTVLRNALVTAARGALRSGGERARWLVSQAMAVHGEALVETVERVRTQRGSIDFYCVGELSRERARTLLTKEPETIEWIDGFAAGDTLWDIGANVGIYSVYAAIARNIRVLAFEPSASNYFLLNRNIETNRLSDHVDAYCVAFSDRSGLNALNMQSTEMGGALSSFGTAIDNFGREFRPTFKQGMVGYSIDDFVSEFSPPFPNHLKIDVDGIEDLIVAGAANTLRDPRLKSISIEIDSARPDYMNRIVGAIEPAGFTIASKRRAEMFDGSPYQDVYNFQFRRKAA